ncbi:MAG: Z1 domain-containing protein [Solirubrobacteraceae bacterium]
MSTTAVALNEALVGAAEPLPLARLLKAWELAHDQRFGLDQASLAAAVAAETSAGSLRDVLRGKLASWDHAASRADDWTHATPPNSLDRRERIYELLDLEDALATVIRDTLPPVISDERTVVIERGGYERWYTAERRAGSTFYWDHYRGYRGTTRGWPPANVAALDEATTEIVERLADPSRTGARQTKGLVVGHVQSGKTANLTGVIAKAADAGYRLIIVLTGLTDLLRNQTQRRIDKELIGREIIQPAGGDPDDEDLDYAADREWDSFISHGGMPSDLGAFDWVRLTGERWDYRRLKAGIESLEFNRRNTSRPFYADENLERAPAKIMIIKKHSARIQNVTRDLQRIQARTNLANVPALIIDDESDQASVNTAKPSLDADEERKRSRINQRIVTLLDMLPRSQYIGYTATPFANVLIAADDEADLFPRDFIISLSAPAQYLGARDFHDLDGPPPGVDADPYVSNEKCFVRDVTGDDEAAGNLPAALDAYVLSGAIKLWRQENRTAGDYRHHTMLVHSSQLTAEQQRLRDLCTRIFDDNGYETPEGAGRLKRHWETDFAEVSDARAPGTPTPGSWSELKRFVGEAVARIRTGDGPVIEVNGTDRGIDPDFDKQTVWKILVGGAKLSRGYTIEGLTISYFRRRATAGDALMQMGRWFGYRSGYRDLVRLYVSREEYAGRRSYDLYEAFEASCRDEELFREQLQRYRLGSEDETPIRPIDFVPLVYSHLEWLPPVPKNKRLNAEIAFENLGGQWREPTMAPTESDRIEANSELFRRTLIAREMHDGVARTDLGDFRALWTIVRPADVLEIIASYRWAQEYGAAQMASIRSFLVGTGSRDPRIGSWLILAPQLAGSSQVKPWTVGEHELSVKRRARVSPDGVRVKAYSEPVHRRAAEQLVGLRPPVRGSDLGDLTDPHRGVMLFYPTHHLRARETEPEDLVPTMGFALLFPENTLPRRTAFRTRTPTDRAFVDATASEDD